MKTRLAAALILILLVLGGWIFLRSGGSAKDSGLLVQRTPQQIVQIVKDEKAPLVLINFWASWCIPCKAEFPHLLEMSRKYADRGLKVILISVDDVADRAAAETFLNEQKVGFQTFFKGDQSLKFVNDIYPKWSGAVPATLLVGPGFEILEAWEGEASPQEFDERVEKHLGGK